MSSQKPSLILYGILATIYTIVISVPFAFDDTCDNLNGIFNLFSIINILILPFALKIYKKYSYENVSKGHMCICGCLYSLSAIYDIPIMIYKKQCQTPTILTGIYIYTVLLISIIYVIWLKIINRPNIHPETPTINTDNGINIFDDQIVVGIDNSIQIEHDHPQSNSPDTPPPYDNTSQSSTDGQEEQVETPESHRGSGEIEDPPGYCLVEASGNSPIDV